LLLLALMLTAGEVARMHPNPQMQAGHTSPRMTDEVLTNWESSGEITPRPPALKEQQSERLCWIRKKLPLSLPLPLLLAIKAAILGTRKGAMGSFDVPLLIHYPIMTRRRCKSPLELKIRREM